MPSKPRLILCLLIYASLFGCATPGSEKPASPPDATLAAEPESEDIRPFPKGSLYSLLTGELAGIRNQPALALEHYREQAIATRDIAVTERAADIAAYTGAIPELLEMTELWLQLDPDSERAHFLAALALAESNQAVKAFNQSLFLFERGNADALTSLAEYSRQMSPENRQQLLALYQQLAEKHPKDPAVARSYALILQSLQHYKEALQLVQQARKLSPDDDTIILLLSQLQEQSGERQAAMSTLQKALDDHPYNRRLRLQYARILAKDDLEGTYQQLKILNQQHPQDEELIFSLAITSRQVGRNEEAKELFQSLLGNPLFSAPAHFQLGDMAELAGDNEAALVQFRQVRQGPQLVEAAARACKLLLAKNQADTARLYLQQLRRQHPANAVVLYRVESNLLLEQDKLNSAHNLLSEALQKYPENLSLLYTRSMVSEQNDDFPGSEEDLRAIIALDENNAMALNALGYTMTIHTDRYQEAHDLIAKALALDPEDPAIMDSMGWVLYHLGRYEEALRYLREAASQFPDPEIIAHLGEVLWVKGENEEARNVWQQILEHDPDNSIILDTIQRLQADQP